MNKRILTIGSAMYDIFLQYTCANSLTIDALPHARIFMLIESGKKQELQDLAYHTGGGATNSAVSFARLGFDVSSFFKIGADAAGKAILDELHQNKVTTDLAIQANNEHTGTSFVIPCPSGDRATLMHRGANVTLTEKELPLAAIQESDYLYVTSLSGNTAQLIEPITHHAKQHNIIVATNPGTSQLTAGAKHLRNALPNINILILNAYEASLLMHELISQPDTHNVHAHATNYTQTPSLLQTKALPTNQEFDLRIFCKTILSHGPRMVVVTNGAEGVYVAHQDKIYFHPSLPVNVISTLGAGDAFSSCFVAHIAQDKPIEYAIRAGLANATSVIEHADTKTGLLTCQEVAKCIQAIDVTLLQTYNI